MYIFRFEFWVLPNSYLVHLYHPAQEVPYDEMVYRFVFVSSTHSPRVCINFAIVGAQEDSGNTD